MYSQLYDCAHVNTVPDPILPESCIVPIHWDIMEDIHWAQEGDQAPPECSPEKLYVPSDLMETVI